MSKSDTTVDQIDLYQIMRAAGQVEALLGLTAHTKYSSLKSCALRRLLFSEPMLAIPINRPSQVSSYPSDSHPHHNEADWKITVRV